LSEPITGIDITDWHIYTVIWEQGNGTFLVDGEVVAITDEVPKSSMDTVIANYNLAQHEVQDERIAIPFNEYIQVDYIHVFGVPEPAILAGFLVAGIVLTKRIHIRF
jgi:hypothetical protein